MQKEGAERSSSWDSFVCPLDVLPAGGIGGIRELAGPPPCVPSATSQPPSSPSLVHPLILSKPGDRAVWLEIDSGSALDAGSPLLRSETE